MPINLNSIKKTAETQISRQKSSINLYAVLYQIIKKNPFINFKMPIKLNSLEKTAETQISRQKPSINRYDVFY